MKLFDSYIIIIKVKKVLLLFDVIWYILLILI